MNLGDDEARVLSALWIEKTLEPHNPEHKAQYEQLRRWSDEARENLGGVADHLSGLILVLAEHARPTPGARHPRQPGELVCRAPHSARKGTGAGRTIAAHAR